MRAVKLIEPAKLELSEISEPEDPDLCTIQVRQVGLCGTDTKIFKGEVPVDYPLVMGHEAVGEVLSAPVGAPHLPGTRVLVDPAVACGWCDLCMSGRRHICRNGGLMGRDTNGVFTEQVLVPADRLIRLPDAVSEDVAVLLQVLGTCVHALKKLRLFAGQTAVVIGLGVAGQLLIQLLTLHGLRVVGVTRSQWKRDIAVASGAADAVSPDKAISLIDDLTHSRGPDLVVEAVGTEETLASAIQLVGIGGEILVFGTIPNGGQGLPYYELYGKELTLHNPRAALGSDYADGAKIVESGLLHLDELITHRLSLADAQQAIELVGTQSLKIVMNVD